MKESNDQLEMRLAVRRLMEREIHKFENETFFGTVPRELFRSLSEIGATALNISESFGGLQADAATIAIVLEEIATANLGPAIFISVHNMVAGIIEKFGSSEQKQLFLPKLASGECLGAYALTEPSAGSDASSLRSFAKKDGDFYILSGEKCYITSAGFADLYVTFARTEAGNGSDGISCFILPSQTPGLVISPPEKKMGCELSPIASLSFESIKLPSTALVGKEGRGYSIALSGLEGGRINIAACANGLSTAAIAKALAHMKERKQFGQPLSAFQGLQFILADMQIKLSAAQALTREAALELCEKAKGGKGRNNWLASMAKCFATDSAMSITTDAVQLLGGAGYIKEYQVERLMRDAKMLQIVEGTNQIQRMVIARELIREA